MTQACDITALCVAGVVKSLAPAHFDRVCHIAVLAVCGAALVCAAVLRPSDEGLSFLGLRWPFSCWLHDTLGIRCALCGMSRSFSALAHGDIAASVQFHRLGPAVFAMFGLQIPYRLYALAVGPKHVSGKLARWHIGLVVLLCLAVLVNWFVYLGGRLL
jgi:hypothetical protein